MSDIKVLCVVWKEWRHDTSSVIPPVVCPPLSWRVVCEKAQDRNVLECICMCELWKPLVMPERLFTGNYVWKRLTWSCQRDPLDVVTATTCVRVWCGYMWVFSALTVPEISPANVWLSTHLFYQYVLKIRLDFFKYINHKRKKCGGG